MRKLLSTKYSAGAFNTATLLLRVTFGLLMIKHGYHKLADFNQTASNMPSLFGMSTSITAALVVFAEFFCSLFIILGLFTRLACIPIVITMAYALFISHNGDIFGQGEKATLFLAGFLVILLLGPGKVSVDNMTGK